MQNDRRRVDVAVTLPNLPVLMIADFHAAGTPPCLWAGAKGRGRAVVANSAERAVVRIASAGVGTRVDKDRS